MKGEFKLSVDKKVTEQLVIENCIMWKYAGFDYRILLFVYALAEAWKFDKLIYYTTMIENCK
jgi:hypothetical protein